MTHQHNKVCKWPVILSWIVVIVVFIAICTSCSEFRLDYSRKNTPEEHQLIIKSVIPMGTMEEIKPLFHYDSVRTMIKCERGYATIEGRINPVLWNRQVYVYIYNDGSKRLAVKPTDQELKDNNGTVTVNMYRLVGE